MEVVITIEQGKVRISVDNPQIRIEQKPAFDPPKNINSSDTIIPERPQPDEKPADPRPPIIGKGIVPGVKTGPARLDHRNNARPDGRENCGYCKRRGEPCVRHGGDDSQNYPGKADKRKKTTDMPGDTVLLKPPQNPVQPVPRRLKDSDIESAGGEFLDPWNCEMCRNAQALCKLHEGLTAEGKAPPLYRHHEGNLANVGNAS